jgi:hypothetical protein
LPVINIDNSIIVEMPEINMDSISIPDNKIEEIKSN